MAEELKVKTINPKGLDEHKQLRLLEGIAGGLAHDFNNLLMVIKGNAELLKNQISDEKALKKLDKILHASATGSDITYRLLALSKANELRPEKLDIDEVLADLKSMLDRSLGQVNINLYKDNLLPFVHLDKIQLETAIMNLTLNASHAMGKEGELTIKTYQEKVNKEDLEPESKAVSGRFVVISISDEGKGIEPEALENIFKPFFTTKKVGEGSGLGLSLVHSFVTNSGGFIKVFSEIDKGTEFRLYFPIQKEDLIIDSGPIRAKSITDKAEEILEKISNTKASWRILLVEDNHEVANIIEDQLIDLGHHITLSKTASGALELLKTRHDEFDLIISDIILSEEMNGVMFVREAQKNYKDIKCLFVSGFSSDALKEHIDESTQDIPLLGKPFSKKDLAHQIFEVMQR